MSGESDADIIISYKNGNEEAFKELVNRYSAPLFNFTARIGGRNEAPDIVQETFIKVWKSIFRFDQNKASFKTWIFTIAKNTTTDFLRKKKSILFTDLEKNKDEEMISFAENIPDENLLPDLVLQKMEDSQLLNKTLEKLRLDYREVLILHYQEEMTFEEIGRVLNKPLNTVKSQHRRALMELRKLLE
ncbi:RNA polymerase sigma factor [Candidatus Nomurabacteria bacterium]|nr:RNA polymerase sigma factor [Candidatus Nomurabacteria bacterium]